MSAVLPCPRHDSRHRSVAPRVGRRARGSRERCPASSGVRLRACPAPVDPRERRDGAGKTVQQPVARPLGPTYHDHGTRMTHARSAI